MRLGAGTAASTPSGLSATITWECMGAGVSRGLQNRSGSDEGPGGFDSYTFPPAQTARRQIAIAASLASRICG